MARGFDLDTAQAHLAKRDRALAKWMKRIGPLDMDGWRKPFDTVDALSRSILYQQLSGKAQAGARRARPRRRPGAARLRGFRQQGARPARPVSTR
jgi:DNA-3-methyladenine glycosylase II